VGDDRPIGVFDSGVGGLTVARAVLDLLPHEPLLYVGDTARSPYGPKPLEEIRRYALEIAAYLVERDVKAIVVACNSVEVSAIGDIAVRAGIPVVGVIDPGTRAAAHATRNPPHLTPSSPFVPIRVIRVFSQLSTLNPQLSPLPVSQLSTLNPQLSSSPNAKRRAPPPAAWARGRVH
jgi:glutamate racemase